MESPSADISSAELLEAHYHAWNSSFDYMPSMALRCALELGIPDIISDHDHKPVTLSDLATRLAIPPTRSFHLYRVMRLLVHMGYFALQKDDRDQEGYTLTSLSKLLVTNNGSPTLAPFLLLRSDPIHQAPSLILADWFRGPHSTAFEAFHGVGPYEYLKTNLDFSTKVNKANASNSEAETRGLLGYMIPMMEGFESLVDVGGSTGLVANIISEALPRLSCTVFDLAHVISDVQQNPNAKITYVAGDAFEYIPSADIIFCKSTLTAFNDEQCLKMLKRCSEAVQRKNKRGKLIIVDTIKDYREATFDSIKSQLCFDLAMMILGGGKERNEAEWQKLFQDAGFTSYKITPTLSVNSIIEVFL